ncbi:peptide/nickel transport system permease protein [Palleronia aestuarii]|uniref:Peptide/nickel transport system permease protein n=1 Tax=Palleronia aestuarii TaxID=568105 RepID=A0A2W7NKM4_9RHOB|nr:ABC transporter permease [Palleronia aestuarii]PZX13736.1 peptide/nickel transport system permease protein [Palleronia aestuarii]
MTALDISADGEGTVRGIRPPLHRGLWAACLLILVLGGSALLPANLLEIDASAIGRAPDPGHPFGTDSLGRDVAARTLAALAMSVKVGLVAATASTGIALLLSLAAASNRVADQAVGVLTELALGLPHFVLLIMIAYAMGGGTNGVVVAIAFTHWPRLARLLRHEAQGVAASDYVAASQALGRPAHWIARHHMAPHLAPHLIAGFVLIFPHAILHEAGLSFIGLGIEPHLPSIGVMLAESLREIIAGRWWVAVAPGAGLLLVALAFERFGEALRVAAEPPGGAS